MSQILDTTPTGSCFSSYFTFLRALLKWLPTSPRSRQMHSLTWMLMPVNLGLPIQMNNCSTLPLRRIFYTVSRGGELGHERQVSIKLPMLVVLGICRRMLEENSRAWLMMWESLGFMISSRLLLEYLLTLMLPQGGQMMRASVAKEGRARKSISQYLRRWGDLSQTLRFFLSFLIFEGSKSLTMYSQKASQRWTATPPTPLKGSQILRIPLFLNRCFKQSETDSGIMEYRLSSSYWIPSSNLLNRNWRRFRYEPRCGDFIISLNRRGVRGRHCTHQKLFEVTSKQATLRELSLSTRMIFPSSRSSTDVFSCSIDFVNYYDIREYNLIVADIITLIMITRSRASFTTALAHYLTPFTLQLHASPALPTIALKSHQQLLQNWWSEPPFEATGDLRVPLFGFQSNQYLQKAVDLPAQIFNHPLRRDLIYRLHMYRSNLNKFRSHTTRTRGMTAGSGAKMRGQKKSGRARMGDKRAPHLRKGGKAHGAKPKVYSFPLNSKIKLKALYSLLSAKLAEGKIKVIDQETLEAPKTGILNRILANHIPDERGIFCFITSSDVDTNFSLAQKNIKRCIVHDANDLDVHSLFIADKIFITVKGLQELIVNLRKTAYIIYRQPYMPELPENTGEEGEEQKIDPEQPYEFKFKILAEYLELYEKVKAETPQLLESELQRVRKVDLLQ